MGMDKFTEIITFILSLKVAAGIIVNLTPTPTDDKWYKNIYRLVECISGIITKKAKHAPYPITKSKTTKYAPSPSPKPLFMSDPNGVQKRPKG